MAIITKVTAYEVLDSRGRPTVACRVRLDSGAEGASSVPSGASTGSHEALELRDGDPERYGGAGVLKAVSNVENELAESVIGENPFDQRAIDAALCSRDGTPGKTRLGANAILALSLAVARAAAADARQPLYRYLGGVNAAQLPIPMCNILNGGRHSDAPVAFQEFMIRPVLAGSFAERLRCAAEVYAALKTLLKERGLNTGLGDEGGFAPHLTGGTREALDLILTAVERAGFQAGRDVTLALDCAASEFFRDGKYDYRLFEGARAPVRSCEAQIDYLEKLVDQTPIDSIEDGMAEGDFEGWRMLTERLGSRLQLVGDDLFVTNPSWLRRGVEEKMANAILIKPNQIGTLTETLETVRLAQASSYKVVISHRSGETADDFIADLAVAVNAGQIKTGAPARGERVAKFNRLLEIEREL